MKNLGEINTNTIEGRMLIAAMTMLTTESRTHQHPEECLQDVFFHQSFIYENVPLPTDEPKTFIQDLQTLINKHSLENQSNTPDFILAGLLETTLKNYSACVMARDKWFGVDMWNREQEVQNNNY